MHFMRWRVNPYPSLHLYLSQTEEDRKHNETSIRTSGIRGMMSFHCTAGPLCKNTAEPSVTLTVQTKLEGSTAGVCSRKAGS